jgi:hypothetical protein
MGGAASVGRSRRVEMPLGVERIVLGLSAVLWPNVPMAVPTRSNTAGLRDFRSERTGLQNRGLQVRVLSPLLRAVRSSARKSPQVISVNQLREACEGLPDLAHRRFVANQWTERAGHWLPPAAWQAVVATAEINDGEELFVGVDVGGHRSATAVAWVTQDLRVGCWMGHGDDAVLEARD